MSRLLQNHRRLVVVLIWLVILGSGLFFRTTGLFRGLKSNTIYHPDSPKQVYSFHNFINGRYVWYDGTLFMDGYPLFLNHFDEWITRPLAPLFEAASAFLYGEREQPRFRGSPAEDYYPVGTWLFYWLRILRVAYSMLLIAGAYVLARILGIRAGLARFLALLVALSPMEWVVAHAATGDIGVSLFGVGLFLALWRHMKTDRLWPLVLAGIFGGFAFASKYHGLIVCGVALSAIFLQRLFCRLEWRRLVALVLVFAASVFSGILLSTPQFFFKANQTRRLILQNLVFLKNYQVPPEILEKPFLERAVMGLDKNTWPLLAGLGVVLVALAAGGLVAALVLFWKNRRAAEDHLNARLAFALSLFALPFYAVFFSLIGKLNVQPFHFCYINIPLFLGAVFLIDRFWGAAARRSGRACAVLCAAALLISFLPAIAREYHFWRRQDTFEVRKFLADGTVDHRTEWTDVHRVRFINNEPRNLPVFRNLYTEVRLPNASFWNHWRQAPVPSIPFPGRIHWIFDNGPVFPRDDRTFVVPRGLCVEKTIVWEEPPAQLKLGLRSGVFPVWVTVRLPGWRNTYTLPANSQVIIDLPHEAIRVLVGDGRETPPAWSLPLSLRSRNGTLWASLLTNPKTEARFRLFGGELESPPAVFHADLAAREEIARQVERCAYYEQEPGTIRTLRAGEKPLDLLDYRPLPGGAYRFEAEVLVEERGARIELRGPDVFGGLDWAQSAWTVPFELPPGHHTIEWAFEKTFVPHTYSLSLGCTKGQARLIDWTLKPDARKILDDLDEWQATGHRPYWAQRLPAEYPEVEPNQPEGIRFGGLYELERFFIPPQPGDRGELEVFVSMRQIKPDRHLRERIVFIHFLDDEGSTRGVVGFSAYRALTAGGHAIPLPCPMDARLAGTYDIWIGMSCSRADYRLSARSPSPDHIEHKRKLLVGRITFPEP